MKNNKSFRTPPTGASVMKADPDMPYAPDDLWWPKKRRKDGKAELYLIDNRDANSMDLAKEPLNEDAFLKVMKMAKLYSQNGGETEIVFKREMHVRKKNKKTGKTETVKEKLFATVVKYFDGEVQLYCRPPWRDTQFGGRK